ncbi:hypothetical protein CC85DRAFT_288991 [Cutaneotrichosporon oleaginosum]|uniref:SnoaL-like domain-containing protein n=1 Tax=Cutaneotrichosporon oleaginosum TaxID=879819 RepID=A0A0J0XD37_9TREE|nr:uncharacterized protein CC85DRAFT_288991 [Cutaneotrichosporon oleaginosum]KLT38962.1 hypothetical protein CC85DRAFT_288991 [Cutaneotrichosporon oleaginosum]TXT14684.1 hypothetical protein COLE_00877 [Cutaneotrichosporon oleaginosum]
MANSPMSSPPAPGSSPSSAPTELPTRYPVVAPPIPLMDGLELQPPLTHRGTGPGVIVVPPPRLSMRPHKTLGLKTPLDPEPVKKWAEEGFAVVGTRINGGTDVSEALTTAISALESAAFVENKGGYAVLVYDPSALPSILAGSASMPRIVAVVSHGAAMFSDDLPMLVHVPERIVHDAGRDPPPNCRVHEYDVDSPYFVVPSSGPKAYSPPNAALAHSRTLVFLREQLGGPYFDLEAIWDEHTHYEFIDRSVEKTMLTMVDEPYVNHVPTMTGGVGREQLTEFYRDHFIFSNPEDADLLVVSRTVGADRVVDEFIYSCTHSRVIDWLLPGVPATGNKIELPMMAVVNIRGDRLYHEHIWW